MNTLSHWRICFLLCCLLQLFAMPSHATHTAGGEIFYECLGDDRYRITVINYRDCIGGNVLAIQEDNPARVGIFFGNGIPFQEIIVTSNNVNGEIIPVDLSRDCFTNPPSTCLNKITFSTIVTLPPSATGYKIVYQRCCRNFVIQNIIDPGGTGSSFSCTIPPSTTVACNTSAVFKNFPPQIICINTPLEYDHSAFDADGDSLSYELCSAQAGGTSTDVKPKPTFVTDNVIYRPPYSPIFPMPSDPRLTINPKTGVLQGKPNQIGSFVITICCHEWRNGRRINTISRDFQFTVSNCAPKVKAFIPQYSDEFNTYLVWCKNYTIKFENQSTPDQSYLWDFGVPDRTDDFSTERNPEFTYPDTGTYTVKLYVNKGDKCGDSIIRLVKVFPFMQVAFESPEIVCPEDSFSLVNSTSSTYKVTKYKWFIEGKSALIEGEDARAAFPIGGNFTVGLSAENDQGCLDTLFKKILSDPYKPFIGNDTTIVRGESIQFMARPIARSFLWSPSLFLNNPNIGNPRGTFPELGLFKYVLKGESVNGCFATDTINIKVVGTPSFKVPNAFTPNNDGKNDLFKPLLVGASSLKFFKVFNRYGEEVFSTSSIGQGWDGTYKGMPANIGVYYWLIGIIDRFGNLIEDKGDVTLIR